MAERLDASLAAVLEEAFGLRVAAAEPVRGLGDECELWRAGAAAVRVSPPWRSAADLEAVYGLVDRFAAVVPESVAPLRGRDGRAVADWGGRPVSVWPWVDGGHLDRDSAVERTQAADLLARLHTAARSIGGGTRPVPRCERCRHWPDLADPALDAAVAALPRVEAVALHGDYYRRNLVVRDGAIAGLLDWDELRFGDPRTELAWAVWEFAKNAAGDDLGADRASAFLDAYEGAGGAPVDRGAVVPLVRIGLRVEVCRARTGGAADDAYTAAEVRAFRALAGRRL